MQRYIEQALLAKAQEMMDEEFSIHAAKMLASAQNSPELRASCKRAGELLGLLEQIEEKGKLS